MGAVNLKAANRRFLPKIFNAVGETLAIAGSEM